VPLVTLFLVLVAIGGCGEGTPPGKVARVGGDGEVYPMGAPIQVDVTEVDHFRHRYLFHAEPREVIPIQAETVGMLLEVSIGPVGERKAWKKGPRAELRERFEAPRRAEYELEIFGDGLAHENTYRLVVGVRSRR
jgi:hypothetical protein